MRAYAVIIHSRSAVTAEARNQVGEAINGPCVDDSAVPVVKHFQHSFSDRVLPVNFAVLDKGCRTTSVTDNGDYGFEWRWG
jgi:hypothetical protein